MRAAWRWVALPLVVMRAMALAMVLAPALSQAAHASPAAGTTPVGIDYRAALKLALVVGNVRYDGNLALRNAARDARLMEQRLRQAGYTTTLLLDTDRATLYRAVGHLADQLGGGGVGVFYYAGHGTEINGRNFLIPVDAKLGKPSALPQMAVPVDYLIGRLKDSGAHLSIVLLDACRNAPDSGFAPLYRGGANGGFVPEKPANGMLVAYATQPGERALDGAGANGPFALALADWLPRPGLPIEEAMKHVMADVRASTRDEQRPWMATSLVGDFALVPAVQSRPTLFLARGGINVDGSRARGASLPAEVGNNIVQWFQSQEVSAQMRLVDQIVEQARRVDGDDLPRLMRQARGGSVVAQAVLGVAYRQGFGRGMQARRSSVEALRWLRMAAAQKMPFALNELGEMYYRGHGTTRDERAARSSFAAAADQGFPPAKLNLLQLDIESGRLDPSHLRDLLGYPSNPHY